MDEINERLYGSEAGEDAKRAIDHASDVAYDTVDRASAAAPLSAG